MTTPASPTPTRRERIRAQIVPLLGLRPWRRHSLVLAVGGAAYTCVGIAYMLTPLSPSRAAGLDLPLRVASALNADIGAWGAVWVIVGLLTFASTRWPPASETWGYTAMSSLSALWSMFYLLGILFFDTTASSFTAVVVWALFAFMWWAVSGLRNPDELLPEEAATYEGK